jgi:DNA polymerase type B, organellar and viral
MPFSIGQDTGKLMILPPSQINFYHNNGKGRRTRDVPLTERQIIAWDGEGITFDPSQPQHYVLFGCSRDIDNPLIGRDLYSGELLRYICNIGRRFPSAVHIGYGFRYDANMIVRHLPVRCLMELKEKNETYYQYGEHRYRIAWLPGKRFQVTEIRGAKKVDRTTVTIDDILAFFSSAFLPAVENILGDELTDVDREVVAHGKAERGQNTWEDMPEVLRYWQAEIRLMQRLGEKFREVMFGAGFMLRNWYGPGALSGYLFRTQKLKSHIVNGPPELPRPVHTASKYAYAGGRFELFRMGRFQGPVYSLDINSAYPYAMSKAPSLGEGHGYWQHIERPTHIAYFGVYRIRFTASGAAPFEARAMPLFHRDSKGSISFPNCLEGWYWSPEAQCVAGAEGVEICEAYVWVSDGNRPFLFLQEMFTRRMELGKQNLMSMPYKLGPNSMYGKFAQRVGFRELADGRKLPPATHCLPLAGWVTSYTRAMLFNVLRQIPTDDLIAVETDGVYTTFDISKLHGVTFGNGLGEWDATVYDEMRYVQSGVYHRLSDKNWLPPKSRGLDQSAVSLQVISDYLHRCESGNFPTLSVTMRPRFIGLSAAAASSAPIKMRHCKWEGGVRELEPGGKGKRIHLPMACQACYQGLSAFDAPHTLVVRSRSFGQMSAPHYLPWEDGTQYEELADAEFLDEIAEDTGL